MLLFLCQLRFSFHALLYGFVKDNPIIFHMNKLNFVVSS